MKKLLLLLTTTVWLLSSQYGLGKSTLIIEEHKVPHYYDGASRAFMQELARGLASMEAEKQRLNDIADANWIDYDTTKGGRIIPMPGRKWKASADTWDDTWAGKAIKYFLYDRAFFRKEDKNFKDSFNDEAQMKFLALHNLPVQYGYTIAKAKSYEHAVDLAYMIKDDLRKEREISHALTEREHFWSSIISGVADVSVIIGGVGYLVAKAAAKSATMVSRIAKITAATEVGTGAFIASIDPNTTLAEAMLVSTVVGAIDYSVIKRMTTEDMRRKPAGAMSSFNGF